MRDSRRVAFHGFASIALLNDFRLESHSINMVCHATEVDSRALLLLIHDLLDVDGAELVLEALGLAGRKLAARFNHVHTNVVSHI